MSSIVYCGVCTMPLEYCRHSGKYAQCLRWMKQNEPDIFETEIKDIEKRDPKTAKKCQYLWDPNVAPPKEVVAAAAAQSKKTSPDNDNDDNDNDNDDDEEEKQPTTPAKRKRTKKVKVLENRVTIEENLAQDQMSDIESKLRQLSTDSSPTIGILKNKKNPNFRQEQQNLQNSQNSDDDGAAASKGGGGGDEEEDSDDDEDGDKADEYLRGQNLNRRGGPPPRKLTKKRPPKKKQRGDKKKRGKNRRGDDDDEEENEDGANEEKGDAPKNDDNEEEEETPAQRQKRVKFEAMTANRKIPKNLVEVGLENRKGNKKVTVVRGFIEKSKDKDQRIKSEFMKKFATSVTITFQNLGAESGPKQVVLMGDKRHDFMRYLQQRFPKASKLLYYKTRKYGLTPAVDPEHGFVMPPP